MGAPFTQPDSNKCCEGKGVGKEYDLVLAARNVPLRR